MEDGSHNAPALDPRTRGSLFGVSLGAIPPPCNKIVQGCFSHLFLWVESLLLKAEALQKSEHFIQKLSHQRNNSAGKPIEKLYLNLVEVLCCLLWQHGVGGYSDNRFIRRVLGCVEG